MPPSSEHPEVRLRTTPGGGLRGRIRVPGDKSISHRAVMLGALADGTTEVSGYLEGEDTLATLGAFRAMGVRAERPGAGRLTLHGAGVDGLSPPAAPLDLGNSGTAMRLLAGLLAGQRFGVTLTGDASLRGRPMGRVAEPLARMGVELGTAPGGRPPLVLPGAPGALTAIDYDSPVASAQVKSCVLLAGLTAAGTTCVTEPAPTRDHTERMLAAFGCRVERADRRACLDGGQRLTGARIEVPGDISSAAFFLVGALVAPDSDLVIEGVGVNPTRTGVVEILRRMGGDIEVRDERLAGGEPVADLRVRSSRLTGIDVPPELVPLAIDEFPAVFVAAAYAEGTTTVTGAAELRVKESDRIAASAAGLEALGVAHRASDDGLRIDGGRLRGGRVDSRGDHRIAMAFAMAGVAAAGPVEITDCANVDTSFPGFAPLAAEAGVRVEVARPG